jgi:hypothetical protein
VKPTGGQENGIFERIDLSDDNRNIHEMGMKGGLDGKRGARQVFEAKPVAAGAAPFGSGANPVSGFRGTRQAFNAEQRPNSGRDNLPKVL